MGEGEGGGRGRGGLDTPERGDGLETIGREMTQLGDSGGGAVVRPCGSGRWLAAGRFGTPLRPEGRDGGKQVMSR